MNKPQQLNQSTGELRAILSNPKDHECSLDDARIIIKWALHREIEERNAEDRLQKCIEQVEELMKENKTLKEEGLQHEEALKKALACPKSFTL